MMFGEGRGLGHIAAHREFHLDRVDAGFGAAVVARRPAAAEAAVDDMAVSACGADRGDRGFKLGRAGRAAIGADIELRQFAVEQARSEEHPYELQSLMRISYAVFCLKKKKTKHI